MSTARRTRRRAMTGFGIVAAAALALAGCSGGSSGGASADADIPTELSGPTELSFWHVYSGVREEALDELIAGFEAENPDVTVNAEFTGTFGDLNAKVATALQSGAAPDVALANPNAVLANIPSGRILDLTPYRDDATVGLTADELDDFFPVQRDITRFAEADGQQMSFPFTAAVVTMYSNTDMLQEAGVAEAPTTWDEFAEACEAVTTLGKTCYAANSDTSTLNAFGASYGARIMDDEGQPTYDSPEWEETLTMLSGLASDGYITLAGGTAGTTTPDLQEFISGQAAFIFNTSENISFLDETIAGGFEWAAAGPPQAETTDAPVTVLYGPGLVAYQSDADTQLASWLFIKYLSSPDAQALWAEKTGNSPVRSSVGDSDSYSAYLEASPSSAAVFSLLGDTYWEGALNDEGVVNAILSSQRGGIADVMTALINGTLDVPAAQAALQAALSS